MHNNEKPQFAKLMWQLGEVYGKDISSSITQIYWEVLRDYALIEVRHAIHLHVVDNEQGQFFPKPANITHWLRNKIKVCALEAWDKVESAIRQVGSYNSVAFDDPYIHIAINRVGGWIYLCNRTYNQLLQVMQHFLSHYERACDNAVNEFPTHIVGMIEMSDKRLGRAIIEPYLMGNTEQAYRISQGQFKTVLELGNEKK